MQQGVPSRTGRHDQKAFLNSRARSTLIKVQESV